MEKFKYKCENGAHHSYFCCDSCWNKHPENKSGETFIHSGRYREVIKEIYIQRAIESGFTESQAQFLLEKN